MKAKILVVDDNQDVVYCVIDSLGLIEPGFEMIGLNSGKECLEQIEHIMPEIDGFETVSRIKQMDKVKNIPVIFLTGKIDNIGKNLGLLIAEDYINKPYDTADLKPAAPQTPTQKKNILKTTTTSAIEAESRRPCQAPLGRAPSPNR